MTLSDLLTKGGPVVWILAAYSLVGLAIVMERQVFLLRQRRLPSGALAALPRMLESGRAVEETAEWRGPEARVVRAVAEAAQQGVADLHSVGHRVRAHELERMDAGLGTLGMLGHTAPLLGLLGTITGMIKAFMVIEKAGGKVDAAALAGGIWEAIITTGVGLAVAIPLVILLHYLAGAVDRRARSMESCIGLLLERRGGSATTEPADDAEEQEHASLATPTSSHRWEEVTDGI